MKLKHFLLGAVATLIFAPITNTFASAQDFYFKDFTADYYLTKLEDGTSNLHVKEVLTAVFPETDQNHGITRTIPYSNQGGKNRTVANTSALNLTVLRNGVPENVNKITANDGYYTVYIGDADKYVNGEQVYTLEYDYTDVITEFDANGINVSGVEGAEKVLQELYWDTNGTGWKQEFDKLTANLHVPADVYEHMDAEAWCYVGSYGEKGQGRCTITPTEDGYTFTTANLASGENLTFAVDFEPGTFRVILEKNYILVITLVIVIAIVTFFLIKKYLKWRKVAKPQYYLYKSLFVAPQYQPPADSSIHVAEGEQIYVKKTESSYVATLLELAVSKKITIVKVEDKKKYEWTVVLNVDPKELTGPQEKMLNILNGESGLKQGDEIPIQKHRATRYLADCAEGYTDSAVRTLEKGGYLQEKSTGKSKQVSAMTILTLAVPIIIITVLTFSEQIERLVDNVLIPSPNAIMVGADFIPILIVALFVCSILAGNILEKRIKKYKDHTESGIKLARYLEGLELYIKMAEEDRLKFLQSVEGADTSNTGIVKLYEKLLPWASLFGAEESWVKELEKYYDIEDVDEVATMGVIVGAIAIAGIAYEINHIVSASTSYREPSSSGGSWSSSSSGGGGFSSGGGGFSGGGGGGGGGGGW